MSLLIFATWYAVYFKVFYITPQSIILTVLFVAAMYIVNSLSSGKK